MKRGYKICCQWVVMVTDDGDGPDRVVEVFNREADARADARRRNAHAEPDVLFFAEYRDSGGNSRGKLTDAELRRLIYGDGNQKNHNEDADDDQNGD
jgi:hypothetical protein